MLYSFIKYILRANNVCWSVCVSHWELGSISYVLRKKKETDFDEYILISDSTTGVITPFSKKTEAQRE